MAKINVKYTMPLWLRIIQYILRLFAMAMLTILIITKLDYLAMLGLIVLILSFIYDFIEYSKDHLDHF